MRELGIYPHGSLFFSGFMVAAFFSGLNMQVETRNNSDLLLPRSFRLPYQQQQHRQVDDTLQGQRQGERFVGRPRAGGSGYSTEIEFEAVQRDSELHKAAPE